MATAREQITSVVHGLTLKVRGNAVVAQDEARNAVFCSLMGDVDAARDAGVSDRTMLAVFKVIGERSRR